MKNIGLRLVWVSSALVIAVVAILRCSAAGTTSSGTRTVDANTSALKNVTTAYGGTCVQVSRDTSSCQSTRVALGFSANWLKFSCNVTLGLLTAGGAAATSFSLATYATLTFVDLPDYKSNYFPQTG